MKYSEFNCIDSGVFFEKNNNNNNIKVNSIDILLHLTNDLNRCVDRSCGCKITRFIDDMKTNDCDIYVIEHFSSSLVCFFAGLVSILIKHEWHRFHKRLFLLFRLREMHAFMKLNFPFD